MAQLVKYPTSAQVMTSRLSAVSMELGACFQFCLPLSLLLLGSCSLSLSLKNKHLKKCIKKKKRKCWEKRPTLTPKVPVCSRWACQQGKVLTIPCLRQAIALGCVAVMTLRKEEMRPSETGLLLAMTEVGPLPAVSQRRHGPLEGSDPARRH